MRLLWKFPVTWTWEPYYLKLTVIQNLCSVQYKFISNFCFSFLSLMMCHNFGPETQCDIRERIWPLGSKRPKSQCHDSVSLCFLIFRMGIKMSVLSAMRKTTDAHKNMQSVIFVWIVIDGVTPMRSTRHMVALWQRSSLSLALIV